MVSHTKWWDIGIVDPSVISTTHTDKTKAEGGIDDFGRGAINTVKLVKYSNDEGGIVSKVLKPLSETRTVYQLSEPEKAIGYDVKNTMTVSRNVATSNVAEMMGMSRLIPKTDVVIHDGKPYIAMDVADGESAVGKARVDASRRRPKCWKGLFWHSRIRTLARMRRKLCFQP